MNEIKKNTTLIIILLVAIIVVSILFGISLGQNKNENNNTFEINIGQEQKEKVNLNTATQEELMSLDGVGQVKSKLIMDNRPYANIHDIKEIKGIGEDLFKKIESEVTVDATN